MDKLFAYVCSELEKRGITYMISGSVAMSAYANPRYTNDLDVVIELTEGQVDALADMFTGPYYFHRPSVEEEIRRGGMFNVIDHTSGQKVDFIVRKNTEFRLLEFERRQRAEVWGVNCWMVALEDLILSKLIWIQQIFSDQQALDIENLIEKNPDLDRAYLVAWVKKLRLKTFGLL